MKKKTRLATIEIPSILLESRGLKTAERTVDADITARAAALLESGRIVESGVGDTLRNLLTKILSRGHYSPEEVEQLLSKVKGIANPAGAAAHPDLKKYTDEMTGFLSDLNKRTGKPVLFKPFQKGMQPFWKRIQELAERAETGDVAAYNSMQQELGNAGIGTQSALGKYWKAIKWLTPNDDKIMNNIIPGVSQMGDNGIPRSITYKQFFQGSGQMVHGGSLSAGLSPGHIVITDPAAVKSALGQLSADTGASAALRGVAQSFATLSAGIASLPALAAGAATVWGASQMAGAPLPQADMDKAGNVTNGQGYMNPDAPAKLPNNNGTGGLGGTTNGNNIGGLGGQFSPSDSSWSPVKPNLPANPNDWLPTGASDYYNLVDRKKSDASNDNTRTAQNAPTVNVEPMDTVVRNLFTILEQGAPGEATFKQALSYLEGVDAQAQTFLKQYQPQPGADTQVPDQSTMKDVN